MQRVSKLTLFVMIFHKFGVLAWVRTRTGNTGRKKSRSCTAVGVFWINSTQGIGNAKKWKESEEGVLPEQHRVFNYDIQIYNSITQDLRVART